MPHGRDLLLGVLAGLVGAAVQGPVQAQDAAPGSTSRAMAEARLDDLARRLERQQAELDRLRRALAEQTDALEEARRALDAARGAALAETVAPAAASAGVAPAEAPMGHAADPSAAEAAARIAPVTEQPGVLTPAGRYTIEPSIQYAYSSSNRIALVGYTVVPSILVGLIDVREVKRSTYTFALAGRVGLGRRLELEAKLPWVHRSDTSIGREFNDGANSDTAVYDARGSGMGDVEFSGRYQLNALSADRPVAIASLRVKSRTGRDPFEVTTSRSVVGFRNDGIQQSLPTGSGFVGIQPGLTLLVPSDPAVFVGGISYLHNVARRDVVRQTDDGPERLGSVAPGGVFGFNFGMGMALNERSSFSIGYDHASIGRTRLNGRVVPDSVRLQLGTLLLGYSYRLDDRRSLNLSLGAGLTQDTPDLSLTLRLPTSY